MSEHARIIARVAAEAYCAYEEPEDAIALLIDAAAFLCSQCDGDPKPFAERLLRSFGAMHNAKHMGVRQ